MAYGPYYTSELMALRGQKKALQGREEFAPHEMEAIVRGELTSRYAAEKSRQSEQRNYDINMARVGMEQQRVGMEQQRAGMEGQRFRQEGRAAEMAGVGQAIQWGGMLMGEGTTFATGGTTTTSQGQGRAVSGGVTAQVGKTGMTTQGGINTLGSGLTLAGMVTGNPAMAIAGAGIRLASPILTPIVNTIYRGLSDLLSPSSISTSTFGPGSLGYGALFGKGESPTFGPAPSLGIDYSGTENLSFRDFETNQWGEAAGYDVDISGGTVICTELHRQGILNNETYLADSAYGNMLPREVLIGYQSWAIPLTKLMRKSILLTHVVSWIAIPWAKEMAYRMEVRQHGHIIGKVVNFIGIPLCGLIGTIIGIPEYMVEEVN